jgi:hypothetical protein
VGKPPITEHPTVKAHQQRSVLQKTTEPLDAAWLRQLCLDAGADDVGFVEIDHPALTDRREWTAWSAEHQDHCRCGNLAGISGGRAESFVGARHAPRPAARKPEVVAGAQTPLSIVNFTKGFSVITP